MLPNFLVVDFDYFFPSPAENDDQDDEQVSLFRWEHREDSGLHLRPLLWQLRAAAFLAARRPLPRCVGMAVFWDRFELRRRPPLLVADSNLHSGRITPVGLGLDAPHFGQVWLYDAHHDAGYQPGSATGWEVGRHNACEDWTLAHHAAGAELHVRYPAWRTNVFDLEPQPLVPIDRAFDPGGRQRVPVDAVFLCRSGAWVPSWCDDQFSAMVRAYPGDHVSVDGLPLERVFSYAEAAYHAGREPRADSPPLSGPRDPGSGGFSEPDSFDTSS